MTAINAEHYEAQRRNWRRLRASRNGDIEAGAAAALDTRRFTFIPMKIELHRELAASSTPNWADWKQAARERRAVLALEPVDLGRRRITSLRIAYQRSGDRSSAREQILYALEIAPNYRLAQDLLLDLRAGNDS